MPSPTTLIGEAARATEALIAGIPTSSSSALHSSSTSAENNHSSGLPPASLTTPTGRSELGGDTSAGRVEPSPRAETEAVNAATHEHRDERAPDSVGGSPARAKKKKKGKAKRKSYDPYDEGLLHGPYEAYYSDGEPVYMDGGEPIHRWTCSNCGVRHFAGSARPIQHWCYVC